MLQRCIGMYRCDENSVHKFLLKLMIICSNFQIIQGLKLGGNKKLGKNRVLILGYYLTT